MKKRRTFDFTRRATVRLAWLWNRIADRKVFTGAQLAREYEVSDKCIQRDIDCLREMGAIETEIAVLPGIQGTAGRVATVHQCPFCGHKP